MRTCVLLLMFTAVLAGCSKPRFSQRDEFNELEPYAQDYVRQVLETRFGSPTNMVVWDELPVDQHLAVGTVEASSGDSVTLDLPATPADVPPGTELLFVPAGEAAEQGNVSGWVREWNGHTYEAKLEKPLASAVAAGTPVIVGPGQVLARGRLLYAQHCQHCHGVTGDGNGPTAQYLNPLPRDYRKGIFKFTSTQSSEKAARQDLSRIIEDGIPGTYMPSFKLLTPSDNHAIVEYVLWLSMRGEMEYQLVKFLTDGYSKQAVKERLEAAREKKKAGAENVETYNSIRQEFYELANDEGEFPAEIDSMTKLVTGRWKSAQQPTAQVVPKEARVTYDADSIARGRKLYLSADLNCIACHGEAGFGDGPQTYSITKDIETGQENPLPGLYDVWGKPIAPRNLHTGIFRGGRRPIDLYDRVHAGIKGTPMPAFGAKLKDQDIWDLVNYLYSVPFENVAAGSGAADPGAAVMKEVAAQ